MSGQFRHAGPITEDQIRALFSRQAEQARERAERFGFDPIHECPYCGDTGKDPETGVYCTCPAGEQTVATLHLQTVWRNTIPPRFHDYTLSGHPNVDLAAKVAEWMKENPISTGQNLVITGGTGRGKTGAAIAAIREMHFSGALVRYWSLPDLMDVLRQEEFRQRDDLRQKPTMPWLIDSDVLLLDDMGTERPTPFVRDRLYVVFNERYTRRRPTIITTNIGSDHLKDYFGERIASRINESVRYVACSGPDLRAVKR